MLFEYVIMTSMFLYGVVQPGASVVPLVGVSDLVCLHFCFSESPQSTESAMHTESDAKSLCVLKIFLSSQGESRQKSARES